MSGQHLCAAAELGDAKKLSRLLSLGADVNIAGGGNGETALIEAAYTGIVEVIHIILSCPNVDVNACDWSGQTALLVASCYGHAPAVALLLSHPDTNPNIPDSRGATPIIAAILAGHTHTALQLLNCPEVHINVHDLEGQTPLILSAGLGQEQVVARLLTFSRLCIDEVSDYNKTALDVAREKGLDNIVNPIIYEWRRRHGGKDGDELADTFNNIAL